VINEIDIEHPGGILRHATSAAMATDTSLRRIALRTLAICADSVNEQQSTRSIDLSSHSDFPACFVAANRPFSRLDISLWLRYLGQQVVGDDQRYLDSPLSVNRVLPSLRHHRSPFSCLRLSARLIKFW